MYHFTLKATSRNECEAIILSFHGKWLEPLLKQQVSVIFRKMGPTWFEPTTIYAYLSQPISAIVAKMPVLRYEFLPADEALALADKGKISKEELRAYTSDYSKLLTIKIGAVSKASPQITRTYLTNEFDYWPSSTFTSLSKEGMASLDSLGNFD
jgi:predicted transcriptional regulator